MLAKGDVTEVVIVNKTIARISINPDSAVTVNRYKDPRTGEGYFKDKKYRGPHFFVSVPSIEDFLKEMKEVQIEAGIPKNKQVFARSIEETNWMTDQLPWLLPILIMVVLWIVMMRRMGGGSSGGPGQIFNIGKSRAQLYDKRNACKYYIQ